MNFIQFVGFVVFSLTSITSSYASAQTLETPNGVLYVGMTIPDTETILESRLRTSGPASRLSRYVALSSNSGSFIVQFTSKDRAYQIAKHEFRHETPEEQVAGEAAFQRYLSMYGAPPLTSRRPDGSYTEQQWTTKEGKTVLISFGCRRTIVSVLISDYRQQMADDGYDANRVQSFFGRGFGDGCPF